MVEALTLESRTPFAGRLGPIGPAPAGVVVAERIGLGVAAVHARKGRADELSARLGAALPEGPRRTLGAIEWLGVGRDRWLAISRADADFADALAARLEGVAAVIDQTGGLGVLAISGPRARDAFAKGLPIDLDPSAFPPDAVAASMIAHMAVTIWRDGEAGFEIAVARSLVGDFAHWLTVSAAEFGLAVV